MRPYLLALGVWVILAIVAVTNGVVRETVLVTRLDETTAHRVSTALLVAAILLVAYAYFTATSIAYTDVELVGIGVVWAMLTVGFEFLVGYIEGTPVSVTIGQYDVLAGEIWILVPLTLLVAPFLFGSGVLQ